MKIAIIDLETTGLDPAQHEIIEIGAVIFESGYPISETLDIKVKPVHPETGQPEAFKVNGYDAAQWEDAPPLKDALAILQEKCNGAIFMAYNVSFDWQFIEQAYWRAGMRNPFHKIKIDLLTLAWLKVPGANSLALKAVCGMLDIPPEPEVHRALNGAKRAFEVYQKLIVK